MKTVIWWLRPSHKEGWALKNWCLWTVVLEKTLESPLDCKEIKPINPKGNQPWIFIERTDAEAETPIFWPPDVKSQLIRKDPSAGKDWRQEENGITQGKMVGRHHQPNGHEFVFMYYYCALIFWGLVDLGKTAPPRASEFLETENYSLTSMLLIGKQPTLQPPPLLSSDTLAHILLF